MRRSSLERAAGARSWRQCGFQAAIDAGVRADASKPLGFGFYADASMVSADPAAVAEDAGSTTSKSSPGGLPLSSHE
jgi:hypothetical protein